MAFDIFEYSAGVTHPEDTVDIYMDNATAYNIRKLDQKLNSSHKFQLSDAEIKKLEREAKALRKKLNESKVTVTLRGVPIEKRHKIQKEIDEEFGAKTESTAKSRKLDAMMFAAHYQKAVNAAGEEDKTVWDVDKAEQFLQTIPEEAHQRLINMIVDLSYRSDNFEQVETSASFS